MDEDEQYEPFDTGDMDASGDEGDDDLGGEEEVEDEGEEDGEAVASESSDSESEPEDSGYSNNENGSQELTLVDGASILIQQPIFDIEDEGDDTGISTQADDEEEEGEGEGVPQDSSTDLLIEEEKKEADKKVTKKKKKKKKWLYICLTNCKYDIVRKVSRKFGFKEVSDDEDWSLYWTDYSVALERVMDMKKYQKINHFPGMSEICRKDLLARNMNRMQKMFPKEYSCFPKTWCLPADYGDFQAYTRQKKNKTYILKPESGCQGKGIWVTRNPKDIKPHEHMICQQYMSRPFLIDGFKFDLRIYTLVTSCDPLRIFVFKDGLSRFATCKYNEPTNSNIDNVYMHLTNYAINKHSEDFIRDDEAGSKRRISTTNHYMRQKGYDVDKMWADIDDCIIKTCISAHSVLKHNYRTCFPNHVKGSACFEILGFDVMLDRKLRPYVIEVNHSPSFNTDSELDREIKGALVYDTLQLVNFGACDRRKCIEEERRRIKDRLLGKSSRKESKEELDLAAQQYIDSLEKYENVHLGNFRRIYPSPGMEKYEKFFHSSGTLFQETAAFKARSEMARQQREEISRKKEKLESMIKGKKNTSGVRPESPGSRRRRTLRRSTMPARRLTPSSRSTAEVMGSESARQLNEDPVDTKKPMDILEEEELERISGLLQRDNLVRGLGIVEHVYRLLHCTPGTMGVLKSEPRPLPPPLENQRWLYTNRQMDSCLAGHQAPIRIKDKQYYKKLLDRYFGHNHALANENNSRVDKTVYRSSSLNRNFAARGMTPKEELNRQFPHVRLSYSSSDKKVVLTHESYITEDSETEELYDLEREREREREDLTERGESQSGEGAGQESKSVLSAISHSASQLSQISAHTYTALPLNPAPNLITSPNPAINLYPPPNPLAKPLMPVNSTVPVTSTMPRLLPFSNSTLSSSSQPGHGTRWQHKTNPTGTLAGVNEKTVPSYQRNKFIRKPLGGGNRGGTSAVIPDSEYRNLSTLLETEAERNRILARNGINTSNNAGSENRSEDHTPSSNKRTLSASGQRKENDETKSDQTFPSEMCCQPAKELYHSRSVKPVDVSDLQRYPSQHGPPGLSVVSGPAPVIQRPDYQHRRPDVPPSPSTGGTLSRVSSHAMHSAPSEHHSASLRSTHTAGLRSTKSQRIRGASNNLRLRQLEMRENNAIVFS